MQISTKMRYGSRVLSELAEVYPEGTVSVRELGELQDISEKYLEHIMSALKSAGIIRSVRGKHGGYKLARAPEEICLAEVFQALEGNPAPVECVERPDTCPMHDRCPTWETWVEMRDAIVGVLKGTSIQDLAERKDQRCGGAPQMYYI